MPLAVPLKTRILAVLGQPEARLSVAKQQSGAGAGAIQSIAAAARAGLPEAQARLGQCYLRGQGVPPNLNEARHWLDRAAEAGDVTARTELASLALRGISGPYVRGPFADAEPGTPDPVLAANLARLAANTGSAEAQALLAYILNGAPDLAEAPGEADALYEESAKAGWPLGQLGHAISLLRHPTPDAVTEARTLLTSAATAGLPTAHFLLGALVESGTIPGSAATHYRAGAEAGHSGSKTRLGLLLLTGRGTPRDMDEAETWLRRAAHDGDPIASGQLGDFHIATNPGEAAVWYRRAAELGHARSAHALARAIAAGAEGRPDPLEIANWLRAAAERGVSEAWREIAGLLMSREDPSETWRVWLRRMIAEGRPEAGYCAGILANTRPGGEARARRHYLWAASLGMIEAMAAAAEMLLNGRGGPVDTDMAAALFGFAAKRDHAGAAFALGILHPDNARTHFRRAAELGHPKAISLMEAAA